MWECLPVVGKEARNRVQWARKRTALPAAFLAATFIINAFYPRPQFSYPFCNPSLHPLHTITK